MGCTDSDQVKEKRDSSNTISHENKLLNTIEIKAKIEANTLKEESPLTDSRIQFALETQIT